MLTPWAVPAAAEAGHLPSQLVHPAIEIVNVVGAVARLSALTGGEPFGPPLLTERPRD